MGPGAPALRGKLGALGNGAPALRGVGLRVGPWGPSTKRQAGSPREGPSIKRQAGGLGAQHTHTTKKIIIINTPT